MLNSTAPVKRYLKKQALKPIATDVKDPSSPNRLHEATIARLKALAKAKVLTRMHEENAEQEAGGSAEIDQKVVTSPKKSVAKKKTTEVEMYPDLQTFN